MLDFATLARMLALSCSACSSSCAPLRVAVQALPGGAPICADCGRWWS